MRPFAAPLLLAVASCTFDGGVDPTGTPDDAAPRPDVLPRPDVEEPEPEPTHLLLSEVKNEPAGEEFVEIWNPGPEPVELAGYHLADTAVYAETPGAFGASADPTVDVADFVVAFPDGAVLEPGGLVVVAIDAEAFALAFEFPPDYSIKAAVGAPVLEPAFPAAVGNLVTITDTGEGIALFYWDGESDLVTDADLVQAGDMLTAPNQLAAKTDLSVDGPDEEDEPSRYARDALTLGEFATAAGVDQSFERIDLESGHETQTGRGNGFHGHDETSERQTATWAISARATPGTRPPSLTSTR